MYVVRMYLYVNEITKPHEVHHGSIVLVLTNNMRTCTIDAMFVSLVPRIIFIFYFFLQKLHCMLQNTCEK